MMFSYAVPARRFYGSRVIDDGGLHYAAGRSLADNVGELALAEWGPTSAAYAEELARLVGSVDPTATSAPHARRWAAAILLATSGDDSPRMLTLIEDRTGVTPTETAARHRELTQLLTERHHPQPAGDAGAGGPTAR